MSTPNTATEIVAEVAEEVADQATNVAEISRDISERSFGLAFGAFVVGAGLGAGLGYIFTRRHLETKYSQISAEEIAEMRQHYNEKVLSLESQADKPNLAALVRDQGYAQEEPSAHPPMAVTPPTAVVEAANTDDEVIENVVEGEPIVEDRVTRNIFQEATVTHVWDHHVERRNRSPTRPYVIHKDEKDEHDAYEEVTFTYYEEDDVLCNDADEVVPTEDRERLIGESSLERFGHGSEDANIVYIRNDQLEIVFEIVRSPNSYAEEVHGFEPEIRHADHRPRGRARFDDE